MCLAAHELAAHELGPVRPRVASGGIDSATDVEVRQQDEDRRLFLGLQHLRHNRRHRKQVAFIYIYILYI
jgi:hypothetical protein